MYMCDKRADFLEIIESVSNKSGIDNAMVLKDYYVSLILYKLVNRLPNVVFKGGTSLSKGYRLIERFSEDIDLTYFNEVKDKPTKGERKKVHNAIIDIINELNLTLTNSDRVMSGLHHNIYRIDYLNEYDNEVINKTINIETYFYNGTYPINNISISNYIYDYTLGINPDNTELKQYYEIIPFKMKSQTLDRTLIDKLFVICDKYLLNRPKRTSRHIYDLYFIIKSNLINTQTEEFKILYNEIKELRQRDIKRNPSSSRERNHYECIVELLNNDFYKEDYENITSILSSYYPDYQELKKYLLIEINKILEYILNN